MAFSLSTREAVVSQPVPAPSGRHYPIPFAVAIESTLDLMTESGRYELRHEEHRVSHGGSRWFGEFRFGVEGNDEYGFTVGLMGSYDSTSALRILIGNTVWVCSNGMWSAELTLARRNTRYGVRDARYMIARALGGLGEIRETQERRVAAYKSAGLTGETLDALMWRAVERRAIPMARALEVKAEYLDPSHDCFRESNVWCLQNAFTEVYKQMSPLTLHARSQALNGLLDAHVGLAV